MLYHVFAFPCWYCTHAAVPVRAAMLFYNYRLMLFPDPWLVLYVSSCLISLVNECYDSYVTFRHMPGLTLPLLLFIPLTTESKQSAHLTEMLSDLGFGL